MHRFKSGIVQEETPTRFGTSGTPLVLFPINPKTDSMDTIIAVWVLRRHPIAKLLGSSWCSSLFEPVLVAHPSIISSAEDFCLWAPPSPGTIGDTERSEVAWCTKSGRGARTIPNGTLKGVHFVQTPDYVQVTGVGDFTKINVLNGDEGGELDPHGADGNGNPGKSVGFWRNEDANGGY